MANENLYLPEGTTIGGRYSIKGVISSNGDGVTYLAYDNERKATVEVREFLPDTICIRKESSTHLLIKTDKREFYDSCLASFLDLYRKLARMRGLSALILVIDIIEENNTGYAVCEHMDEALSVKEYITRKPDGFMTWEEARVLFMPVLGTLANLHKAGIIHRGISLDTLIVGKDNKIRISGFSIPECRNVRSGLNAEIFQSYAPVEQFGVQVASGPWTDVYAFSAVLFRVLTGNAPIPSMTRMKDDRMMIPAKFAELIPAYVINALINGLQIMPEDRTKTVEQLHIDLSASQTAALAADFESEEAAAIAAEMAAQQSAKLGTPASKEPRAPKKSKAQIKRENKQMAIKAGIIVAAVILLIFGILCLTVLKGHFGSGDTTTKETTTESIPVEVPEFVGRTYTSISSQSSFFTDFTIETTEEYSDEINKGYVISQSVEAGETVQQGTTIVLTISLGKEEYEMPNVVGSTYEDAVEKLKEAGFTEIKKIDVANDGTKNGNTVASSLQKAGEMYGKEEVIKLNVYVEKTTTTTKAN